MVIAGIAGAAHRTSWLSCDTIGLSNRAQCGPDGTQALEAALLLNDAFEGSQGFTAAMMLHAFRIGMGGFVADTNGAQKTQHDFMALA
jgi:hypothetical protein